MNTNENSGNDPQYVEHNDGCAEIEASYMPWWASTSANCNCGADEHNAYVDGYREGAGIE